MLLVSGRDVKEIEERLTLEMDKISKWLDCNKLSLHLGKTESILFASKKILKRVSSLEIVCNDVKIEPKTNVKYLGAVIDQDMSGKTMCTSVIKKVNAGLKFLYRKSGYLNFHERKLLCSSLLQSRFDYGFNVFYRCVEKRLQLKLQTAQNKIVRFILGKDPRHHLMYTDFRKVKYLNVKTRIDYLTLNTMYNIFYGTAPSYLCVFKKVSDVHSYSTRRSNKSYVIPHVKSQGSKSFSFNGCKLWNNLPNNIKSELTKDGFKSKCKEFLFNRMLSEEESDFIYY